MVSKNESGFLDRGDRAKEMEAEKKRGWWKKKKWCMTGDKCSEA